MPRAATVISFREETCLGETISDHFCSASRHVGTGLVPMYLLTICGLKLESLTQNVKIVLDTVSCALLRGGAVGLDTRLCGYDVECTRYDGVAVGVVVCELGWWLFEVSRLGGHPPLSLRSRAPFASRKGLEALRAAWIVLWMCCVIG